jgi:hypothetical protein
MTVAGGRLYVGGTFPSLAGMARTRLGALNLSNASVAAWAPAANDTVLALSASPDGSAVYAGGAFTSVSGASQTKWVAKMNAAGAVVPTNWGHIDGPVLGLDGKLDATHVAISMGGASNSGGLWTSTGTRLFHQVCDGDGQAVLALGDYVYSGFHEGCNGQVAGKLDANSISGNGARDTAFLPVLTPFFGVRALAGNATDLVAAGTMSMVGNVKVGGFAIFPHK